MKVVFLSYINRSGSTFLANELSKSKGICVCPESEFLVSCFLSKPKAAFNKRQQAQTIKLLFSESKFVHWGLLKTEVEEVLQFSTCRSDAFMQILLAYKQKQKPNAKAIVFKHNNILKKTKGLSFVNCEVYYLALQRLPLAIFESQKRTFDPETGKVMCANPLALAMKWKQHNRQLASFASNKACLKINFDALMRTPNESMAKIVRWLGETFESQLLGDIAEFLPPAFSEMHIKAIKDPLLKNLDSWKSSLTTFEKTLIIRLCKVEKNGLRSLSLTEKGGYASGFASLYIKYVFWRTIDYLRELKLMMRC